MRSGATEAFSLLVLYNENGHADVALYVRNRKDHQIDQPCLEFSGFGKSYFLTAVSTGRHRINVKLGEAYKEMLAQYKASSNTLIAKK